jgi:hypothetical protein
MKERLLDLLKVRSFNSYIFLESESYSVDQLKPKAARLTKNFIDDIANRYVNQADDENEDSPVESDGDSD